MPTIGIRKAIIDKHFGKIYSEKEFEELCFDYGLELDEVTSERIAVEKERGEKVAEDLCEEEVYKIELPANRYDLLAIEGLSRAMRIFLNEIPQPKYEIANVSKKERLIVLPETESVRPFVVAAILRNVKLDADAYASFIDLQDKLHQNICRKRTLVAIGTHDLDTVQGPFTYGAEKPDEIRFRPLNESREFTAKELMVHYSGESHLKQYLHIIADKERYPVIRDRNGIVLSLPPIINGEHSKIHLGTRNIFIEATATDLEKARIVLDTVVTLFSQYCEKPFTVEPVDVQNADGTVVQYPELKYRHEKVSVDNINRNIGLNLMATEMAALLSRMSLSSFACSDGKTLEVVIPPTRHDILHECDIAEDVAIAFGFNRIVRQFPREHTVAEPFQLNKLSELLRFDIAAAGWTEALNFALCSCDDISTKMRKANALDSAVKIANPKTIEFQVARTSLLPGLFKTLASNRDMPLPLKLFELQDVVLKDPSSEVGARNERRLSAVYYSKTPGFEIIHGLLDRVMQLLGVKWTKDGSGYYLEGKDDCSYLDGRCARVVGPGDIHLGTMGVVHPEVITAFGLTLPLSAFEITIEPFL
uniref:Phenylalanine--tRNA ligase beta subunit n=1 Tax=Ascaris suum TaxID=6253 RepID=F1KZG8_ASCSU